METTTYNSHKCKHELYLSGRINPNKATVFTQIIDVEKERKKKFIRKLNILAGSAKPCLCLKCNPDTSGNT